MTFYSGNHDFDNGDGGRTNTGRCKYPMRRKNGSEYRCNASWTSVLHPPDQFRHWCSTLEAGGDCMHFEFEDD